jgi:hypothetical protein
MELALSLDGSYTSTGGEAQKFPRTQRALDMKREPPYQKIVATALFAVTENG